MAEEMELSDYTIITDNMMKPQRTGTTNHHSEKPGRRLPALWILALGVLCLAQAILNVSLRLGLYSKEKLSQLPVNSSGNTDLSCIEMSPDNLSVLCFEYNSLLRKYQTLEKERDRLQLQWSQLKELTLFEDTEISSGSVPPDLDYFSSATPPE